METNETIVIFRKFCSGFHQDFDLASSSIEELIEFCRGFLTNEEVIKFKEHLMKVSTFDGIDQLKLWNSYFENAFLKNSTSAQNFTHEVIKNIHV